MIKKYLVYVLVALVLAVNLTCCDMKQGTPKTVCEHEYGVWEEIESPTCFKTGYKERTCIKCGEKDSQTLEQLDHVYSESWERDEKYHWHLSTCCGKEKSEYGEHTVLDGVCTVCGYEKNDNFLIFSELPNKNGYAVIGITEKLSTVKIPENYNGKPVMEIGEGAFQYNCDIISVEIPESVIKIGEYAFSGCRALNSVEIKGDIGFTVGSFKITEENLSYIHVYLTKTFSDKAWER